jgi:hypothetical protein
MLNFGNKSQERSYFGERWVVTERRKKMLSDLLGKLYFFRQAPNIQCIQFVTLHYMCTFFVHFARVHGNRLTKIIFKWALSSLS